MSTQTKIKGIIVNNDLPVLTSDGLVSRTYVDFVEALAAKGYTMSATQKSAVSAFLASLAEYGLTDYILSMFPFVCSPTKRSALSVPLIGTTTYGSVPDSWTGAVVSDGAVIGVSRDPDAPLTTLGDLIPSVNFFGVSASFKKENTEQAAVYNDRALNIAGKLNFRIQKTATNELVGVYYIQDAADNISWLPVPQGFSNAGHGCAVAMFRNPLGYVRFVKFNAGVASSGSEIEEFRPPRFVSADLSATLTSVGDTAHTTWTSLTTFKKLMTKEQAERYAQILETFMAALGRTA